MQQPVLSISAKFITKDPNNVIITDSTNYAALGLDPTKVKMTVKIFIPTGVLYVPAYYNTPQTTHDFTPAVPFNYITKLGVDAIPDFLLDSHGCFIKGKYKFEVKWYYQDTAETFDYSYEETINIALPVIKINQTADCFCAKFRSTDVTDYTASTQVTYDHIINYPAETNEPDIETGLKDYTDQRLANGTYVTEITTERIITISPAFSLQAVLYGKKSIIVDCDTICDIKCGINNLNAAYETACGKQLSVATELKDKLEDVLRYYSIIYINNACGGNIDANSYIQKIKAILGDCDCGCKDCDESVWITGVCGSSGGSAFDPTAIYTYIDSINTALTNLINIANQDIANLTTLVNTINNRSWFEGLVTSCLVNFPSGTEVEKKQFIIDALCQILSEINKPPVARNDFSSTFKNVLVEKLVTANDFFTSNVVATITTAPLNGTAVVLADGKTIRYTPNTGYTGIDSIGYTITDAYSQTSSATWQVSVNPTESVACSIVTAQCVSEALPTADNKVQFIITDTSNIGTNVITAESYIIDIYDVANTILHSYMVTGSPTSDPTVYVSANTISTTWDHYKVRMQLTTNSSTGSSCGTELYETESYSLTDINSDIFSGITAPCLSWAPGDTQQQKMQALINKLCSDYNIVTINGISGNGSTATPAKLGGALTENTNIDGNFTVGVNAKKLAITQNNPLSTENLLQVGQVKEYSTNAHFNDSSSFALAAEKKAIIDGVFNLSTLNTSLEANVLSLKLEMTNTSSIDKAAVETIGYGDVSNLILGITGANTDGGHVDSMRNLTLAPIFKSGNASPFTVDKYISLAIMDITQTTGTPADWIVPTVRYAIYQEGATDINLLNGLLMLTNLPIYADEAAAASLPTGQVYRTLLGSLRIKL
jgi:hypothetical protein